MGADRHPSTATLAGTRVSPGREEALWSAACLQERFKTRKNAGPVTTCGADVTVLARDGPWSVSLAGPCYHAPCLNTTTGTVRNMILRSSRTDRRSM